MSQTNPTSNQRVSDVDVIRDLKLCAAERAWPVFDLAVATIKRLTRERDEARAHTPTAAFMRIEAERDEWAAKWHKVRAELAELKYPGMKGVVRPMGSSDETCESQKRAHISDLTVRHVGAGYVVTWQEDGEPCGSETISEKLAYALARCDGGVSGITDDRGASKASGDVSQPDLNGVVAK